MLSSLARSSCRHGARRSQVAFARFLSTTDDDALDDQLIAKEAPIEPPKQSPFGAFPIDVRAHVNEDSTPGHVLAVLNQATKQGKELPEEDFRLLIETARDNEVKDARCIMTALRNYKRTSDFWITKELAVDCVARILKSDPTDGPIFILEHFSEESGLYFAAPLDTMHQVLELANELEIEDKDRVWDAIIFFTEKILLRWQRPYQKMKKRARLKWLRQARVHAGPQNETVQLLVEIGLKLRSANDCYLEIVEPMLENRIKVDEDLLSKLNARRLAEDLDRVQDIVE